MSGRGMDPDATQCFTDSIIKENLKRLNWFAKNYEKLAAENRKPREKLTKQYNMGVSPGFEKFVGGYDNRRCLGFNSEREKDVHTRMTWFENYYDLCYGNLPKEQVPKGAKVLWEALAKKRAETAQSTVKHVVKKDKMETLPQRDLTVTLSPMKPVPPEIHDLIYQGISQEDEGAKRYLKVRYTLNPDDKYYSKDCTNWVYGWGINEFDLHRLLRIPRVQIIKQSFYRRGGVERDPDHYRDAVKTEAPMFFPQL